MTEEEAKTLREIMKVNERCREILLLKYGYGVRPSWVSADLARYEERIDRAFIALGEMDT